MTVQDPPRPDNQRIETIAKQLADLERQTAEVDAALKRSASVRLLLTVVVVAMLVTYGYLFYMKGRVFTDRDYLDHLKTELQLSAQLNSTPILHQAHKLFEDTWPSVSAAMATQMKQDMPEVMKSLGAEREILAANVRSRMEGLVQGHYNKAIERHRAILAESFPSVKDDGDLEVMSENFKAAFRPLVKQHYGDKLEEEFNRMFKTWDTFPRDESNRSRDELSQELYQLLFSLMQEKVAKATDERPDSKSTSEASGS